MSLSSRTKLAFAALALPACTGPALAALGQGAQSIGHDGRVVGTPQRVALVQTGANAPSTAVTRQVVQTPRGVVVTEYLDSAGTVFALSWHGPVKPDLQQLLGAYFADYLAAAGSGGGGLASTQTVGSNVVVRSAGSMQGFVGAAYLPGLMPAGFTPAQIR